MDNDDRMHNAITIIEQSLKITKPLLGKSPVVENDVQ